MVDYRDQESESLEVPEFVSIPVPVDRVNEVYKLLASPPSNAPATVVAKPTEEDWSWLAVHTDAKQDWPVETILRAVLESNPATRRLLKYLADHQGKWLSTPDIAAGLQIKATDIRGPLSGLSRRIKHRYKMQRWFFDAEWNGQTFKYRMHEREAAVVGQALAQA